jgi:hypothetical protein
MEGPSYRERERERLRERLRGCEKVRKRVELTLAAENAIPEKA